MFFINKIYTKKNKFNMTLGELFSNQVSEYITEVNKKYPDITSAEFCKMVEEFVEKNKASIIEEAIDLDDELGEEGEDDTKILSDDEYTEETETESEYKDDKSKPKVAKIDVTKERKTIYEPLEGVDKRKEEVLVRKKRKDVYSEDDRYIVHDGVTKIIVKNSERDKKKDIHNYVDRWYKNAEKNGQNLEKHTLLEFFVTTEVTDMSALFAFANVPNIDLSSWDTSNVKNMEGMFYRSSFNNNSIENWDVSSCINFRNMFVGCRFSGDISGWVPGTYEEIEYSDDGSIIKEEDEDGVWRERRKMVRARLPEVGARLVDIETEEDLEVDDILKGLGKKIKISESKHVLTIDEFINEGLYDTIKKGFKKGVRYVKDKLESLVVMFNDFFVANINPTTNKLIPATDPITAINYIETTKPKGVRAFTKIKSPLLIDGVQEKATIQESDERYGRIKKGSLEERNYVEFMKLLAEINDNTLTEERIGLDAKSGGLKIKNITTPQLEKEVTRVMLNVPDSTGKEDARALTIYGAPGIGKTTIPKTIIKKWNEENPDKKKAIIVVECGDLELGGFNLPIPREIELGETISFAVKNKLIKDGSFTDADFDKIKGKKVYRTYESPKTWLPVYQTTGTKEEIEVQHAVANGRTFSKMVYNEKRGGFDRIEEETTEGGILMFDEFLRADPELFKTICQLVKNRTIGHGEYRLGDKWGIILCSNRPLDDDEVFERYGQLPPAMADRFANGSYNYIPDFNYWLDWAKNDGYFDEYTIKFLSTDTIIGNKETYTDSRGNAVTVYKNWHTIDKEKFVSGEEPIPTTPRGWAALMDWVDDEKRILGVSSILEIDMEDLKEKACAVIGETIGEKYYDFMCKEKSDFEKKSKPKISKFFEGELKELVNTKTYTCEEAVKDIEAYIKTNLGKVKILSDPMINEKLLFMTKNLERLYKKEGIISTTLKVLHNNIIQNIYRLRSKDKDSKKYIEALKPYLEYVGDKNTYNASLLKPLE